MTFDLSDDGRKEIKRPLILFVDQVVTEVPDLSETFQAPIRNVRLEMSRMQAEKLRDFLTERLDSAMPGNVGVQFRGHLVI